MPWLTQKQILRQLRFAGVLICLATSAAANPCSLVTIDDTGQIVMLDPPEAIALFNECSAAASPNAPKPTDPCDVRLHFGLDALSGGLQGSQNRMRLCIDSVKAVLEARRQRATPLHDAINSGQGAERLAAILEETQQEFVNVFDSKGLTPLHVAIENGADPQIVRLLLDAGADPTARTGDTGSAFRHAVRAKAPFEVLTLMMDAGADPTEIFILEDISEDVELTIFHDAVYAGYDLPTLRVLFDMIDRPGLSYHRLLYMNAIGHDDPLVFDFITEIADLPKTPYEATELLYWAVEEDADPQIIYRLFQLGADRSSGSHYSNTRSMLHQAILREHKLETIRALVENGATMGDDVPMEFAMMLAVSKHPDPEVIRYLGTIGLNPTMHQNFKTAVYYARRSSSENAQEKLDVLLELGFVEEFICDFQCPSVRQAVVWDRPVADIRKILDAGGDIHMLDRDGEGVLHAAVALSADPGTVIPFLISAGADPNLKSTAGETPLTLALGRLLTEDEATATPIIALLNTGADPDLPGDSGIAPIFTAIATQDHPELIGAFGRARVNMQVRDDAGQTPLFALLDKPEIDRIPDYLGRLIASTQTADMTDAAGNNALHIALRRIPGPAFEPDILTAFINAGYDVNRSDRQGNAPLHLAAKHRQTGATFAALLTAGADPNAPDSDGLTPLHLAAMVGHGADVFQALLDHGADPQIRSPDGALPITLLKANTRMRQQDNASYKAALAALRDGGGGTNMIREWHQRCWTPWIGAGLLFLIAVGIWVWRNTRPVRIV